MLNMQFDNSRVVSENVKQAKTRSQPEPLHGNIQQKTSWQQVSIIANYSQSFESSHSVVDVTHLSASKVSAYSPANSTTLNSLDIRISINTLYV